MECLSYIEDLALALREDGKCSATPDDGAVQPMATGRWALWVFGVVILVARFSLAMHVDTRRAVSIHTIHVAWLISDILHLHLRAYI